jgi:ABC-2 type transport system ATP-binding protein
MIHLQHVEKYYGDKLILNIPELKLENGVYWVEGINGSGKTTILKILSGLMPFKGDVLINNISIKKKPVEYRRSVSFSEAEPLYPSFITGSDLVLYYQDIRKAPDQQVDRLIAFSGLRPNLANAIGTYSSGMVKRLSLLLAFIGKVRLIVLDEPLATLDTEAAQALPGLINEHRKEYGTSFIFTSHQPFLAEPLLTARNLVITAQTIHHTS